MSLVDRFKFGGLGDARIVHERVKSSAGLCETHCCVIHQSLHLLHVGDVRFGRLSPASACADLSYDFLCVTPRCVKVDNNPCALIC